MAGVVGNANFNYGGIQLGAGAGGPIALFFGDGDPSTISDSSPHRTTVNNASPGSLYLRTNGSAYLKNSAGVWTQITVP